MSMMLKKKLVLINVGANNVDATVRFYETFFGLTFNRALTQQAVVYNAPIDEGGVDLNVGPRHSAQDSITTYFAVNDLNAAITEAKAAGSKIIWGPAPLQIPPASVNAYKAHVEKHHPDDARDTAPNAWNSVGEGVLITDPSGNAVGLVQLAPHAQGRYNAGRHQRPLTDQQVAGHNDAIKFGG